MGRVNECRGEQSGFRRKLEIKLIRSVSASRLRPICEISPQLSPQYTLKYHPKFTFSFSEKSACFCTQKLLCWSKGKSFGNQSQKVNDKINFARQCQKNQWRIFTRLGFVLLRATSDQQITYAKLSFRFFLISASCQQVKLLGFVVDRAPLTGTFRCFSRFFTLLCKLPAS